MTEIFDTYLEALQRLITWEQPASTGFAFLIINFVILFIIRCEWRIYGVIFSALLVAFLCDAGLEFLGIRSPDNQPTNWSRQIVTLVAGAVEYLRVFRDKHPNTFRIYAIGAFFALNFLGRTVSGATLTFFAVFLVFLTPLIIEILPEKVHRVLKNVVETLLANGEVAEDDLVPTSRENERDDCESTAAESCTNSFVNGLSSMPSHLDVEGSLDGLEEEDLEIPASQLRKTIAAINFEGSSSESECDNAGIVFESRHFNGDSSSDESNYVQGHSFAEDAINIDEADSGIKPKSDTNDNSISSEQSGASSGAVVQLGTSLLSNIGSMSSNLVTALYSQATARLQPTVEISDDSDFEIIDNED